MTVIKRWERAEDGVQFPIWVKGPDDVEDYTLDWANRLVEDDFIIGAEFYINSDVHIISVNFTDRLATVWITGGVVGTTYDVTCRITTDSGRVHERTFRLVIANK